GEGRTALRHQGGVVCSALARELAPHAKRHAEARARPGHERVAADAMALRPLADAPHRVVSYSQCQTAQSSSVPARFVSGFFSFLFSPSSLPTPERGDWRSAQRRPALYGRTVTRDATLARQ